MLINSNKKLNDIEKSCITLATVQQNEDAIEVSSTFDGATKTYRNYKYPIYDSIIPTDILKFDSANYVLEPEKRPFYGAYMEEYKTSRNSTFSDDYTVIKISILTPVILISSILFICVIVIKQCLKEDVIQLLLENDAK